MLLKILSKIAEGTSLHSDQLSLELEVPAEQIQIMLDHLVRDGYLKHFVNKSEFACASPCGSACPGIDSTPGDSMPMWAITPKGLRAISG